MNEQIAAKLEELGTKLEALESNLEDAKEQAEYAENEAYEAKNQANEAQNSAEKAKNHVDSAYSSLEEARDILTDLTNELAKDETTDATTSGLEGDRQKWAVRVIKLRKLGMPPPKIASELGISEFLVNHCLKHQQAA